MPLGLTHGTVRLAESEPGWPAAYQRLAAGLRVALGERVVAVEHVGSTAVPGLVSKPILDLAVGLGDKVQSDGVVPTLEALGYRFRGDKGDQGGLLFVLEDRPAHRIAHVHVVRYGDERWRRYLSFRDRLRADSEIRAAYGALKHRLAAQFAEDRPAYTAAKASFIAQILGNGTSGTQPASSFRCDG